MIPRRSSVLAAAAAAVVARGSTVFGECSTDDCLRRLGAWRSADRRVTGTLERGGGIVLAIGLAGPDGAGPRVVETLPEDLGALGARVPGVVAKLFAAP
jgi:hypothetical protein